LAGSAFGDHAPVGDPDADGKGFGLNLRYPGQYFDAESGLHYNLMRDYDPSIGRYVESDRIGLSGGLSIFAYVNNRPLTLLDPTGELALNTNNCSAKQRGKLRQALDQMERDWERCYGGDCEKARGGSGSPMLDKARARDFLEVAMSSMWISCERSFPDRCGQMQGSAHSPSRSAPADRVGAAAAGGLWPRLDIVIGCNDCLNQDLFHELLHFADTYQGQSPENDSNHELIDDEVSRCAPCLMPTVEVVSP